MRLCEWFLNRRYEDNVVLPAESVRWFKWRAVTCIRVWVRGLWHLTPRGSGAPLLAPPSAESRAGQKPHQTPAQDQERCPDLSRPGWRSCSFSRRWRTPAWPCRAYGPSRLPGARDSGASACSSRSGSRWLGGPGRPPCQTVTLARTLPRVSTRQRSLNRPPLFDRSF